MATSSLRGQAPEARPGRPASGGDATTFPMRPCPPEHEPMSGPPTQSVSSRLHADADDGMRGMRPYYRNVTILARPPQRGAANFSWHGLLGRPLSQHRASVAEHPPKGGTPQQAGGGAGRAILELGGDTAARRGEL